MDLDYPFPNTTTTNDSMWDTYDISDLDSFTVPPGHRAVLALYTLIFLIGVIGNGAVIWVTASELRRTVNGVWFLNLSMADLLCCLALPFLALPLAWDHHWPLGRFACKLIPSITILNMFASVLLLTAISADRYALVARPVWCHNHRRPALARALSAGAWALAAALTAPSFAFRTERRDAFAFKATCVLDYAAVASRHRRLVEVLTAGTRFALGFAVPFAVITACYGSLLARIRTKGFARSQRATKLILVVITTFFTCWLPYHVVGIILASSHPSSALYKGAADADAAVTGIAYVNSCVNPVIYAAMGQGFKGRLWRSWRAVLRGALSDEVTEGRVRSKGTTEEQSVSTMV
ncbi:C5a anaphylatoxin chemotactic receptor 1 [Neopsephotus bourkii]|uniref:C5a anaphylatoxin chemotactic receptor 1 n=1 Tax=Neopsephotus bourkii TaxID=309878 RepID=UPI002AA52FFF|nr:C5a anaphylatoxin chemotactic receptor 1 [Neopsephotus bourkii]